MPKYTRFRLSKILLTAMLKMEQWERTDRKTDRGNGNTGGRNENLYV